MTTTSPRPEPTTPGDVGDPADTPESGDAQTLLGNYFVSTFPPFSQWSPEELPAYRSALADDAATTSGPVGVYVHIPFCVERCQYCYYLALANAPGDLVTSYLDALETEAELYFDAPALRGRGVTFAYFGGGTPSLLTAAQIDQLFAGLRRRADWSQVQEITFECAPRSVTRERLQALRRAGVNRLSMGVQQLDDEILERNGRIHRVVDVERAWDRIRGFDFQTVNLDLIVGLRGETEESFTRSLDRVVEMSPESVTLYQLEIPLNTPLAREVREGTVHDLVPKELKLERLARAFAHLESAGYTQRSAYTSVRDPQRHRFDYQDEQYRGADLIGLGAASFSYLAGVHQQNCSTVPGYLDALRDGRLPLGRAHQLTPEERLTREMVLQLKLGSTDLQQLERRHGIAPEQLFAAPLRRLERAGWLRLNDHRVELTRGGLLRVDELIPELYPPRYRGVRYS